MGTRRIRRDRYLELWRRVGVDAVCLAFLLDPDPEAANATAHRAFGRCVARMQDRRSADLIDVWFRREVVRQVARRTRRRRLRRALPGGAPAASNSPNGPSVNHELWRAFMLLPLKQRAAIVLDTFEHMPRLRVADVLGRSEAGTGSLVDRGWEGLEARLGARPDDAELERLLTVAAERFEAGSTDAREVTRIARRARWVSAVVAICLTGGAAAGAVAATTALSTSQQDADVSRTVDDEDSSDGGSAVGLGFRGSPGWCPDPRRALPLNQDRGRDATRTAIRVAIAVVKGYTKQLDHLIEVPAGAPPARRWAAPGRAAGLRVLGRGFGGLNDSLAINCGVQVAERTWIAILEDREPPADDAVAFYVVLRPDGYKVWGSHGALGR